MLMVGFRLSYNDQITFTLGKALQQTFFVVIMDYFQIIVRIVNRKSYKSIFDFFVVEDRLCQSENYLACFCRFGSGICLAFSPQIDQSSCIDQEPRAKFRQLDFASGACKKLISNFFFQRDDMSG